MNPGGSVKDRAGLAIILDAERRGALKPGGTIVEGTAGNTGIGLTLVAPRARVPRVIVMPDTQSREKIDFLRMIGADLRLVPAKPYAIPATTCTCRERLAAELGAVWANQFDNQANREGHRLTTGPEIWHQTAGRVDAFTCSCGTGGTLAGVSMALKTRNARRADRAGRPGRERAVRVGEVGGPFGQRQLDHGGDRAVARHRQPGRRGDRRRGAHPRRRGAGAGVRPAARTRACAVGGSAGINVAAAIRVARDLGPGHTVVTILCDGGGRYQSKLFNPDFLRGKGLPTPPWMA